MEPALGSGNVDTATAPGDSRDSSVLRDPRLLALRRPWLAPSMFTIAAALLSIPRLGSRTLWLDETYTVGATNELFDTWRNTAGTQALYYLLVWPVSRISTDPVWLRLPSALLGLAAVVVVFRLARRIGGQREAVLAAGGLALSWGLARFSVEARSYTLALLLVSTSWLALIAAIQADTDAVRRRWWRAFYAVTVLVPLAHGLATLNFVAQLAALAIAPGDQRRMLRRGLVIAPALAVELGALFLLGASEVGDWVPPLSVGQLKGLKQLLLGFDLTGLVLSCLVAAALALPLRRFARERSHEAWMRVLPVFWALGPPLMVVLMSLVRPYAASRYVFASLPAFFLLLAALVARLGSAKRVTAASLVIALLLLADQRYVTTDNLEDWPELMACMAAHSAEGDRLITAAAHRPPLDYYWSDHPQLANIEPLAPPEPMGSVHRLYQSLTDTRQDLRSVLLEDTTTSIWYVERSPDGQLSIAGLALDPEVMARYELKDFAYFDGDLMIVRLDPIGVRQSRRQESCDTIETPKDLEPLDQV